MSDYFDKENDKGKQEALIPRGNWKTVEDAKERYWSAFVRHNSIYRIPFLSMYENIVKIKKLD